jgi:hypothetical protein
MSFIYIVRVDKKKLPHIMGNEVKPYNEKITTTLPTRPQQHITYRVTRASMPPAASTTTP